MVEYIADFTGVPTKQLKDLSFEECLAQLWGVPIYEEIVRCRDCEHFTANDEFWLEPTSVPFPIIGATSDSCDFWAGTKCKVTPDGFCKWGKRKEDA